MSAGIRCETFLVEFCGLAEACCETSWCGAVWVFRNLLWNFLNGICVSVQAFVVNLFGWILCERAGVYCERFFKWNFVILEKLSSEMSVIDVLCGLVSFGWGFLLRMRCSMLWCRQERDWEILKRYVWRYGVVFWSRLDLVIFIVVIIFRVCVFHLLLVIAVLGVFVCACCVLMSLLWHICWLALLALPGRD